MTKTCIKYDCRTASTCESGLQLDPKYCAQPTFQVIEQYIMALLAANSKQKFWLDRFMNNI